MTATADWAGLTPETRSQTRCKPGSRWGVRRVQPDGTVLFLGRRFRARTEAAVQPVPGEWVMVYDYGERWNSDPTLRRDPRPVLMEWTAPADPDGYIRRSEWDLVEVEP